MDAIASPAHHHRSHHHHHQLSGTLTGTSTGTLSGGGVSGGVGDMTAVHNELLWVIINLIGTQRKHGALLNNMQY